MKARKSPLAAKMQQAKTPIRPDGKPFQFEGKWYVANFIPVRLP